MKQTIKLSESKLRGMIGSILKETLEDNNWYVCAETDYNEGVVYVWITNSQEDVDDANNCSEGWAEGPYSREQARELAQEYAQKGSNKEIPWEYAGENEEGVNNEQLAERKQTIKLNESQLRNIIKNVLRESLDIDNILSDLTDNADDYDLAGVEFTDEDAQRVITLMQENGLSYDDALSQVLSEIQDVISQGYEDFDEDDYIDEAVKKSIKKVLNEGQEEIQNRAVEALSSIGIEVVNKTPYEILKELKEMYGLDCHVHPDRDGEMCYWWITDNKTGEVLAEGDDTPYGNGSERFNWEIVLEMCKLILNGKVSQINKPVTKNLSEWTFKEIYNIVGKPFAMPTEESKFRRYKLVTNEREFNQRRDEYIYEFGDGPIKVEPHNDKIFW